MNEKKDMLCSLFCWIPNPNAFFMVLGRFLVKNLIVGYFSTPVDKRKEVLRIIATVLDFNREDRQKSGLESTSMWPFGGISKDPNAEKQVSMAPPKETTYFLTLKLTKANYLSYFFQSLSEAFIRFLENESKPRVQPKMSIEEVTRRHSKVCSCLSSIYTTTWKCFKRFI